MFCTFLEQLEKAKSLCGGPGAEAPRRWAILAIFQKIASWMTFWTFLEQLETAKLLR